MITILRYQTEDGKSVDEGVLELRIDVGAGYRVCETRAVGSRFAVRREQEHAEDGYQIGEGILGRLEAEKQMKHDKTQAAIPHHDELIKELRADRMFAVEYLRAALSELDAPDNRAAGLLAMRDVVEAYGGLGAVAQEAGINRESLYRALSPKGNPTLKTILAVMKAIGMKLSVEPSDHVHA